MNDLILVRFETALRVHLKEDRSLIRRCTNEQTLTASLACALRTQFPDYHVDVEYNRNMDEMKRLKTNSGPVKNSKPDIIVHTRESNDDNKLVIEAKGHWNSETWDADKSRIEAFACSPYNFSVGIVLMYHEPTATEYRCEYQTYMNGVWSDSHEVVMPNPSTG
ncbi:MAG: hypothetical protein R3C20_10145 [Planctomycetaceae bacterium]